MKLTLTGQPNYKQSYDGHGENSLLIRENTGEITVMFYEKKSNIE